jgi:hypothetical protein
MDGDVRAFAIDPHDERVVYLGTGPVRLYRSEDGGTSWESLDSLLDLPEKVRSQWTVPKVFEGKEVPHIRNVFIHPDVLTSYLPYWSMEGLRAATIAERHGRIGALELCTSTCMCSAIIPKAKNVITFLQRAVFFGAIIAVVSGAGSKMECLGPIPRCTAILMTGCFYQALRLG